MKRREFISLLGAAALVPVAARARQPMPVVGFLLGGSGTIHTSPSADAFRSGLLDQGFVEGQNVSVEYRWAQNRPERVPELVADLVRHQLAVICTSSNVTTLGVVKANSGVPLVFTVGLDPVAMGLVSSFPKPERNATGVYFMTSLLEPKRLELLRELLPELRLFAALINPENPNAENHVRDLQAAASKFGLHLQVLKVRQAGDLEMTFSAIGRDKIGAVLVTSDPLFDSNRPLMAELAAQNSVPVMYPWRSFVEAGGLLSYGNSLSGAYRQVGVYAGRILKGDKAGDLPVWVPTKFEFVLNLKAAKALGLDIPPKLLALADEVIE